MNENLSFPEYVIDYFKKCCNMAKENSNSHLTIMCIYDLVSLHYGFNSYQDLLARPFELKMHFDTILDLPIIMEVIVNA